MIKYVMYVGGHGYHAEKQVDYVHYDYTDDITKAKLYNKSEPLKRKILERTLHPDSKIIEVDVVQTITVNEKNEIPFSEFTQTSPLGQIYLKRGKK